MAPTTKSYSMRSRDGVAALASTAVEILFRKNKKRYGISSIINVEKEKKYQSKDIDLLVHLRKPDNTRATAAIEIKGDTYPSGDISPALGDIDKGNFFFEVISNDSKAPRTPGCFMYTESDVVYYLYLSTGTLYQLKTNDVRDWFTNHVKYDPLWLDPATNLDALAKQVKGLRKTSTITNNETNIMYSTWGITIPIKTVLDNMDRLGKPVKKMDMLLEVLEAAVTNGYTKELIAKMPDAVKNRANDVWRSAHPEQPSLDSFTNVKVKLTPTSPGL